MSVPDSMAGHFEACPACKALVAIPGPNDAPAPRGELNKAKAASPSPTAGELAHAADWLDQSAGKRKEGGGVALVLEIVGLIISALGVLAVVLSVLLMLLTGPESSTAAGSGITNGTYGFLVGLLFSGLGAVIAELKKIRRLLQYPARPRP
jgi:hypothetical protein